MSTNLGAVPSALSDGFFYSDHVMKRSLLLVHGPLVGPSALERLAVSATRAGHTVALPDLTCVATAESPHESYTQLAASAGNDLPSPVIAVGHSGAGAFLPAIGAALESLGGLIFVDAVVPPRAKAHRTPDGLKALLDEHTIAGLLNPWLDWWTSDVVAQLLPDPDDQIRLRADMPQLTRAFYDLDVAVPPGWADGPCGYLRLSDAYEAENEEAAARGWPTVELDSTHLGMYTSPNQVLDGITSLLAQIE